MGGRDLMGDLGAALTARFLDDLNARLEKIENYIRDQREWNNRVWKIERAIDVDYTTKREDVPAAGIVRRLEAVEAQITKPEDQAVITPVQMLERIVEIEDFMNKWDYANDDATEYNVPDIKTQLKERDEKIKALEDRVKALEKSGA